MVKVNENVQGRGEGGMPWVPPGGGRRHSGGRPLTAGLATRFQRFLEALSWGDRFSHQSWID